MKSRTRCHAAFTLLELVVAVTIITFAIGWATVHLGGLSEQGRLQAAATQLGAIYRTAADAANRSGLPRRLIVNAQAVTVAKPTFEQDRWSWTDQGRFDLVRKVSVQQVRCLPAQEGTPTTGPPWVLTVTPGERWRTIEVHLQTARGASGYLAIDGFHCTVQLRMGDSES